MLEGIAVALGGGSQKEARGIFFCQLQRVKGALGADFQGGNAMGHVVHRAGGRGEMINLVHAAKVKGTADIALDKFEFRFTRKMLQVVSTAGQ